MAQPKKLTYKQKQEKAAMKILEPYKKQLQQLHMSMRKNPSEMETWRWAALELFKEISGLSMEHGEMERLKERALFLAREAQGAINFGM